LQAQNAVKGMSSHTTDLAVYVESSFFFLNFVPEYHSV